MKRIFITGLAGLLGANFAFLKRDEFEFWGVDKNPVCIEGVGSIVGSAFDLELVETALIENKIDVLCHCAALVNVDLCETNSVYADLLNHELTKNLAFLCHKLGIKFVFISTDAVFAGTKTGLYREEEEPAPINIYGKTKVRAENAVARYPENLIIRTNFYGFNYREKNSFAEWVVQALNSDESLNMFTDLWFSPILVNHLVDILAQCIKADIQGLYHVSCTGSISKYDLGAKIQKQFMLRGVIHPIRMDQFDFVAPRTQNMGLDNSKICEVLAITLPTPEEDVKTFYQFWQDGYQRKLREGIVL